MASKLAYRLSKNMDAKAWNLLVKKVGGKVKTTAMNEIEWPILSRMMNQVQPQIMDQLKEDVGDKI